MSPETQSDPEGTPEATPPKGGSGAGDAQQSARDWEKSYKGLQVSYDKLQAKYAALKAEQDQTIAELEEIRQGVRSHETEKGQLNTRLQTLESEKSNLEKTIQSLQLDTQRQALIMSEFTDLAPFEGRGLLPKAENMDELRQKLIDFRTAFKSTVDENVQKTFAGTGAGPAGSGATPPPRSKDVVYAELLRLAGTSNPDERAKYEALQKEWDELSK